MDKTITYSYNESGNSINSVKEADGKTVFTVELEKMSSGKDVYDFQLKKLWIMHMEIMVEMDFDLPFKFSVTSNGTIIRLIKLSM